jgi:hypothetical protein
MLQLVERTHCMRNRMLVAATIGVGSGMLCWFWLKQSHLGAGDFNWSILAAQDLLAHRNPYQRPMQLYPLTAALFGLPFCWMRPAIAGGLFYGLSSALLAFGISRHGYYRLLVFLAYPYWAGLIEAQWPALILAGAFVAPLLPASLAKPQLGLPILLTAPTKRGLLLCVILLAVTFVLMPAWPWQWWQQLGAYARFIPFLVFPGPLLALALFRYRQGDARLLLLASLMPQRWFYDAFILWFIPKSRREIAWTALFSWGAGVWRWYHPPHSFAQVGRWTVLFMYLPMLAVVLLRERHGETETQLESTFCHPLDGG